VVFQVEYESEHLPVCRRYSSDFELTCSWRGPDSIVASMKMMANYSQLLVEFVVTIEQAYM
jgi:hypothetical protein